jgi:putative membrane protein
MPEDELSVDASRRTRLANERTWLAWLRTGLTAMAVALAVGKIVPDVAKTSHRWPYVVLGVGYAALGVALVLYGARRHRDVDAALEAGGYSHAAPGAIMAFASATALLGLGTAAVLLAN